MQAHSDFIFRYIFSEAKSFLYACWRLIPEYILNKAIFWHVVSHGAYFKR